MRRVQRRKPRTTLCSAGGNSDPSRAFLEAPVPGDRIVRTMSANGEVSVRVVSCTGLVSGATTMHQTSPVAAAAFGRALTCALLLASGKKNGETLQLEFRGDGPIRGITAIATGDGEVRGYMGNPSIELPPSPLGKLDVGRAVGEGILAVVRNSPFQRQPYTGLVKLVSGEIAEDVATYLADSEQTPSALGAGVYVSKGQVTAAGGYLVQLLPGASESTAARVEQNVQALPPPTDLARQGLSPDEICDRIMDGLSPLNVAWEAPRYACSCSEDRVKRTVALLPENEVRDLLETHGRIQAKCEFCGVMWELSQSTVEQVLEERSSTVDSPPSD